jgi:hypothetical protein
MRQCAAIKREGGRCGRMVSVAQDYCYAHDPSRQEERKRNAARGGRTKAAGEVARVKARLEALADSTLSGEIDTRVAAVTTQIWNTYLAALRTEMRARELEEHEARLAELERLASLQSRQPIGGGRLQP